MGNKSTLVDYCPKLDDIADMISDLNLEMQEMIGDKYINKTGLDLLSISSDGNSAAVIFMGNRIWSTEDERRDYYEDNDSYQNLEDFTKIKILEMIKELNKIKFKKAKKKK